MRKREIAELVFVFTLAVVVAVIVFLGFSKLIEHNRNGGSKRPKVSYTLTRWENLLPKEDLEALLKAPMVDILEGSDKDTIASPLSMTYKNPKNAYEKAMMSVNVRPEFNKKHIKLPGFIVPLDVEGEGKSRRFFFVPFFGACLHLPPPPPNQIIYATYSKGIQVSELDKPYYIEAEIFTKQTKDEMATAAYSAKVAKIYDYVEPKLVEERTP